jgi:hypothetical protein
MRTLLAPGSGDNTPIRLQRGGDCDGALVVHARIDPAPAEGAYPQGDIDKEGFGLHLRYTLDSTDIVPRTTYTGVADLKHSNAFSVEFGSGTHALNYGGGTLELVGGTGLWMVDIQARPLRQVHMHWHWLLWRAPVNVSGTLPNVSIPTHHSLLGSYTPGATVNTGTGDPIALGQTAIPVFGSVNVQTSGVGGGRFVWLFSGWFG